MDTEPDSGRTILITEWAKRDLKELIALGFTKAQWETVCKCLEGIARKHNVATHECVVELRMCEEMYRWKACNLRVVFEVDETTMTVWAVLIRSDETYKTVFARLKKIGALA